jgi:hypothetical protein
MRITNRDRSNLDRFGCAFLPREKVICISWGKQREDQVLSASIITQAVYVQCVSGPVLSLAFEISPTKALPHYCFFPFDLKNTVHRKYLSGIFTNGKIQLRFLADSGQIVRTYEVLPHRCKNMAEAYATAIADFEQFPAEQYNFDCAVSELEQEIRIVDYFLYCLSETELERQIVSLRAEAENVSPEERAQAAKIVNDFLAVFRSRYDSLLRKHFQQLAFYSRTLLLLADLHGHFEGNYAGAAQFFADSIATRTPKKDIKSLEALTPLSELVFNLLGQMRETVIQKDEASWAQLGGDLRGVSNRVDEGKGISFESLRNILSSFGVPLGGQPGRPVKDYSAEYELRAAGKTWRNVAEYTLENNPETWQEFGGRKYDQLTFQEQETLKHRVRVGVLGFAERMGKVLPPRQNPRPLPPSDGVQKNPG